MRCYQRLSYDPSRLQVNLEIALSGASAKVKASQPFYPAESPLRRSDDVIKASYVVRAVCQRLFDSSSSSRARQIFFNLIDEFWDIDRLGQRSMSFDTKPSFRLRLCY